MSKVFYGVYGNNGNLTSIQSGKHGLIKAVFDEKKDAEKIAQSYPSQELKVRVLGLMEVVR